MSGAEHPADAKITVGGKRKIMIYVPPRLHRAMRTVALDDGRSASDVYADAARAFLMSRGMRIEVGPGQAELVPARSVTMADLATAMDRLGQRIDETLGQVVEHSPALPQPATSTAGTKAADAMRILLGILREAGPAGLSSGDISDAMYGAGVTSGAAETAKAVMRGAGLVRCERRRWFVEGA